MNDLIVLTVKNLKTNLKGKPFTLLKDYNSCEIYSYHDSESLRIYGWISVQRLYIAKYTKTVKNGLYRSNHQEITERCVLEHFYLILLSHWENKSVSLQRILTD